MNILLISTIKQFYRDKEALFWSLIFPAIFIVIFSFFSFGDGIDARILIVDRSNGQANQLVDIIQNQVGAGIHNYDGDIQEAKESLTNSRKFEFEYFDKDKNEKYTKESRVNLIMSISELDANGRYNIELFYDESQEGQASPSLILINALNTIETQKMLASNNLELPFDLTRTGVSVNEIRYFDVLVPGIIGMSLMQSGIIGIASGVTSLKEKRVLKRLAATPLPIWRFLLANIFTHLVLSVVQVTIMLVLAHYLLGANIYGSIPLIYFVCFIGNFVFLSIGFIAAGLSKTSKAAEGLSQVFTTPMMFLSGVFFERDGLPGLVKVVSDFLPLSPLLDALRAISLQNAGLLDIKNELFVILIWTVITTIIATRIFKFKEE